MLFNAHINVSDGALDSFCRFEEWRETGAGAYVILIMSVWYGCHAAWHGIVAVFHEPGLAIEVEVCAASESIGNPRGQ